jgi:hypothetical protein
MAKKKVQLFAEATWCYEDIQDRKPDWSRDKCEEFLCDIESDIRDRMIEAGWDVIDDALAEHEDEEEEDEDDE